MKKIYFLSAISIFSLNLYCQTEWTKHPDNPVMVPGSATEWDKEFIGMGSVIYHNNSYHMWYSGGDLYKSKIGYATSGDGSTWMKYPSNPVMLNTCQVGNWECRSVSPMSVMDSSGVKYKMWYWGSQSLHTASIGYAESICCPWNPYESINERIITGLSIYPNPVQEVLTIETSRSEQYTIDLTTLSGQLLYRTKMERPSIKINLSSFQNGLYFITIRSWDYVRTLKIVKM